MRDVAILPSFVIFCFPHGDAGKLIWLTVVVKVNCPLVVGNKKEPNHC